MQLKTAQFKAVQFTTAQFKLIWRGCGLASLMLLTACQNLPMQPVAASPLDQEIYTSLNTQQCQTNRAEQHQQRIAALQQQLQLARIAVKDSAIGHDGQMRLQQCGMADGNIAIFRIDAKDVMEAQQLGYRMANPTMRKINW